MSSSIARYPHSRSAVYLARATRAVEGGFIAAGVTVCLIAAVQSFAAVLSWLSAL